MSGLTPRTRTRRRTTSSTAAAITFTAAVALLGPMAGNARAQYAEVDVAVDCRGVVSYRVRSWPGRPDDPTTTVDEATASRSNDQVRLSFSTDGGASFLAAPVAPIALLELNGFGVDGSFRLAELLPDAVAVRTETAAPWGDGALGEARETAPLTIPDCPPAPTTTADANTNIGGERSAGDGAVGRTVSRSSRSTGAGDLALPVVAGGATVGLAAVVLLVRRSRNRPL